MNRTQIKGLLQQIADTQEQEISCSDCFDAVDRYVQDEVAGEPVAERWPALKQHLGQCRVCREEYEALRDLVLHETQASSQPAAKP